VRRDVSPTTVAAELLGGAAIQRRRIVLGDHHAVAFATGGGSAIASPGDDADVLVLREVRSIAERSRSS